MTEPFTGEIALFAFNFPPRNWAVCAGQLLPIAQNTALFSLLGTHYGGDGRTTFALPNLQGRVPVGAGQGRGLSPYVIGQSGGAESVTLTQKEMPQHRHPWRANPDPADLNIPSPTRSMAGSSGGNAYVVPNGTEQRMAFDTVGLTGLGLPHSNLQPSLNVLFCIAIYGIYPQRP